MSSPSFSRVIRPATATSRATVRMAVSDLSTPYALHTLQGVADVSTDRGTVRYHSGTFTLYRRNAPSATLRWQSEGDGCAARMALTALATL